nr:HAD-IB family hydrolase [Corynebacterium lactis]
MSNSSEVRTDRPDGQVTPAESPHGSADARIAAFFDLDKTIIARSSAYAFNKQFLERGIISPTTMMQLAFSHAMYMSQGHDDDQMEQARDQLSAMVAGHSADELRQVATESLETSITPYIYAEALELIRKHQSQGRRVYIVSASAREVVEPIADMLGVDHVVATDLEKKDGVFTGAVEFFCRGENKAIKIREIAEEFGHDLTMCFAYSDSITDEPMLAEVGHPLVVNPDKALRKLAVERGWPVRQFRNPVPLLRAPSKRTAAVTAAAGALAVGLGAGFVVLRRPPK